MTALKDIFWPSKSENSQGPFTAKCARRHNQGATELCGTPFSLARKGRPWSASGVNSGRPLLSVLSASGADQGKRRFGYLKGALEPLSGCVLAPCVVKGSEYQKEFEQLRTEKLDLASVPNALAVPPAEVQILYLQPTSRACSDYQFRRPLHSLASIVRSPENGDGMAQRALFRGQHPGQAADNRNFGRERGSSWRHRRAPSHGRPDSPNLHRRARSSGGPVRQSPLASASAQKEIDENHWQVLATARRHRQYAFELLVLLGGVD